MAGLGFFSSFLEGVGIESAYPAARDSACVGTGEPPGPLAALTSVVDRFEPDTRLVVIGCAILGFIALKGAVQALNITLTAWVDGRAGHDVRVELARRLLTISYPFFLREGFGRLFDFLSTDLWRASDAIRIGFSVVANIAASLVFITLLLMVHWKLTLVVGAGALAIRLIHNVFRTHAERMSQRVSASNLRLGERMVHILQAMRLIRVFGQEDRELYNVRRASNEVRRIMIRVEALPAVAAGGVETANAACSSACC